MRFRKKSKAEERVSRERGALPVRRPEAYHYHSVRDNESRTNRGTTPQTHRSIDVKNVSTLERAGTVVFVFVVISSLLYVFWLSTSPKVRFVANDADLLLQEESIYATSAQDILNNSLLSQTKLTLHTQSLSSQLLSQFPEIATATVTIPLSGHRPVIELQPKQPKLLLLSRGVTYVVDDKGTALIALSDLSADKQAKLSNLPRITDSAALDVTEGTQALTNQTVDFVQQLAYQYAAAGKTIARMVLPADKPNELHVITTDAQYIVKYLVLRPADEQFGSLVALQERLTGEGVMPADYIDVRVESKAFYK